MSLTVIDAVIFDMDGTLIDSSDCVPVAYAAAVYELSGRRYTVEEIIDAYSLGPATALLGSFIGRAATDADVECWYRHLDAHLHRSRVYSGVEDMLGELNTLGIPLAIFTGATRHAAEQQLAHMGIRASFAAVVGSDEIAAVKPAPDGIHRACELLGVDPARAAYVGDALNDLRCARAAGALPVAAGWGHLYEPAAEVHVLANSPTELIGCLMQRGS